MHLPDNVPNRQSFSACVVLETRILCRFPKGGWHTHLKRIQSISCFDGRCWWQSAEGGGLMPNLDTSDSVKEAFFSEEKKRKTFMSLSRFYPAKQATITKVFWFFFSKKNCFSFLLTKTGFAPRDLVSG